MLHSTIEPPAESAPDHSNRSRVLIATSGSAASTAAAAAAAVIARERDGELWVVHVRPPEVMRVGRLAPTIVRNLRLRDPHASTVLGSARQVAWTNGAFARVVLMTGDPVPAILSLASELAVDLIVIGARRSRTPAVLAARTRYRIGRDAPCPVSVVPLAAPTRLRASLRGGPGS